LGFIPVTIRHGTIPIEEGPMKLTHVSLLLVALTACEEEPLAPDLRQPVPNQDSPVVIVGRVVSSATAMGIQSAIVRVLDGAASVGTDESGRYRIVLPAKYRGQTVAVNVRAIGYRQQDRTVSLADATAAVDLGITMAAQAGCILQEIVVRTAAPIHDAAFTASAKVKQAVRAAK
jgi:hypothetical protein